MTEQEHKELSEKLSKANRIRQRLKIIALARNGKLRPVGFSLFGCRLYAECDEAGQKAISGWLESRLKELAFAYGAENVAIERAE